MKKWIAILLIIAMMSSFVGYADVMDFEDLEVIIEDDGQSREDELNIETDVIELEEKDELNLDDFLIENPELIGLELDTESELEGNDSVQPNLSFTIGNINGTKATFNKYLEDYITNRDSDNYYPDLAYMLVALAGAAYHKKGTQGGLLSRENAGYQSDSKELEHITNAYEDLGFNEYQVFNYYNNPDHPDYGADNVAFSIGRKQLSDDDALVLIVIRGSYGKLPNPQKMDMTFSSDWQSNAKIKTNSQGRHLGFARAADKVYSALKIFMRDRQYSDATMKSKVRYVITGHSRGAAVANLLAVKLHDVGVPNSKVYDYNFACPDTVKGFRLADLKKNHENIFNICNSADAVSVIPGIIGDAASGTGYVLTYNIIKEKFKSLFFNWGKYGTTWFYCKNWNDPKEFDLSRTFDFNNSPHDTKYYIPDIGKNTYKFYSWRKIVARGLELGARNFVDSIISYFYPQYAVVREDIAKAKVTVSNQVYTGKAIKPAVSVILNKKTLKKDTDYSVTYNNNKNIGTATVTVTGKGNYTGTIKANFSINPKAVTGFVLTAGDKYITANWNKMTGVTGYQIQYGIQRDFSSANKITITKSTTTKKVIKDLTDGETYFMRIRAYKTVGKKYFYSAWSGVKKAKTSGAAETTIRLDKDNLSLNVGDTYQLTCFVSSGLSGSVSFSSSNAAVATVDANALITAVGVGEATISASMDNGATAICEVTVNDQNYIEDFEIEDDILMKYLGTGGDVVIPNGVTGIGDNAFEDCESLTSVTIPSSVTWIGSSSFCGCKSLVTVTIPGSVSDICNYAFSCCENLTNITIPSSVTAIGGHAFSSCKSLTKVIIPNNVRVIAEYTFYGCTSLRSVTIPSSVSYIGDCAFMKCNNLTDVSIPDSVGGIGESAFRECSSLNKIVIPNKLKFINRGIFYGCISLTSITIPDGVITIESWAFSDCENLTSVTILNGETEIMSWAFSNCKNLTIYSKPDSYAERYALAENIPFVLI